MTAWYLVIAFHWSSWPNLEEHMAPGKHFLSPVNMWMVIAILIQFFVRMIKHWIIILFAYHLVSLSPASLPSCFPLYFTGSAFPLVSHFFLSSPTCQPGFALKISLAHTHFPLLFPVCVIYYAEAWPCGLNVVWLGAREALRSDGLAGCWQLVPEWSSCR